MSPDTTHPRQGFLGSRQTHQSHRPVALADVISVTSYPMWLLVKFWFYTALHETPRRLAAGCVFVPPYFPIQSSTYAKTPIPNVAAAGRQKKISNLPPGDTICTLRNCSAVQYPATNGPDRKSIPNLCMIVARPASESTQTPPEKRNRQIEKTSFERIRVGGIGASSRKKSLDRIRIGASCLRESRKRTSHTPKSANQKQKTWEYRRAKLGSHSSCLRKRRESDLLPGK